MSAVSSPPNIPLDDAWLTPYLLAAIVLMLGTAAVIRIGKLDFPGSGFVEWSCIVLTGFAGLVTFFVNLAL